MKRFAVLIYGLLCYVLFLGVFLYLVGFVMDFAVPHSVSSGAVGPVGRAVTVDLLLMVLFGVQHSMMARRGFKQWLTRMLPESAERSTYVLATNIVLILIYVYWQPLPGQVWQLTSPVAVQSLYVINGLGWLIALVATFLTNHFDLFGLRQIYLNMSRRAYTPVVFREILLYRWIRHPMMLGLLIAVWATPVMTTSHLLFSMGMTLYIIVGIHFEEAALQAELGETYRQYRGRTRRLLPFY